MPIDFDTPWMLTTVLLWVRMGVVFFMSPWVSAVKAPSSFPVLLTLVMSGLLTSSLGLRSPVSLEEPLALVLAVLCELVTGAVLGFAVQCAFAAFSMAGQVLDVQIGFGLSAVFNPVTRNRSPVLGTVFSLFAVAFFFAIEGPQAVMRGLAFSATQVPLGAPWFVVSPAVILRPVGAMFTAAVVVIAPALFMMMLLEMVLSVASRALPQMNVFFVGLPLKILSGFAVLALTANLIGPVMTRSYAQVFQYWDGVLR